MSVSDNEQGTTTDLTISRDTFLELPYGRDRFDNFMPCPTFADAVTYAGRYMEVHPGPVDEDEFREWWNREPVYLNKDNTCSFAQWVYRGAKDRIICRREVFQRPIQRGDPVILYRQESAIVKYFVTLRRGVEGDTSVVQMDAYSFDGRLINDRHPDWGTQIFDIPTIFCNVPFPRALQPFYPEYFEAEDQPPPAPFSMSLQRFVQFLGLRSRSEVSTV